MSDWNFTTGDQTPDDLDSLLGREWLAVNGLGGYASSSVPGMNTRKYHGLLVAAMSPPGPADGPAVPGRGIGRLRRLAGAPGVQRIPRHDLPPRRPGASGVQPHPFPRWAYQGQGWTVEKTLRLLTGTNTVVLTYTLLGGDCCRAIELQVRPAFALRGIHDLMYQWNGQLDVRQITPGRLYIPATGRTPEVFSPTTACSRPTPGGTSTRSTAGSRSGVTPGWKTCGTRAWSGGRWRRASRCISFVPPTRSTSAG